MSEVKRYTFKGAAGEYVYAPDYDARDHSAEVYFGSWKRTQQELDAQRLRADTAEAELHHLREQLKERDAAIENLNDRHDLGVQERDRLRAQLSAEKALRLENQRIIPVRFKCLACGDYHEGSGNVPCPKMSPYAALNPNPEAESHEGGLKFYPPGKCPECEKGQLKSNGYRYECNTCEFNCGESDHDQ